MDHIKQLINSSDPVPKEALANIINLTFTKEIYRCWKSNDEGEEFSIYTGTDADGVTPRYFLKHFERVWWGGWTSEDKTIWYEITKQEYLKLYQDYPKP